MPIAQEEKCYSYGDAGVSEVEDGAEEDEGLSSVEGTPLRVGRFDEWEVEHVDDLAVEEGAVALAPGDELCYYPVAGGEDLPVEEAVDDIA